MLLDALSTHARNLPHMMHAAPGLLTRMTAMTCLQGIPGNVRASSVQKGESCSKACALACPLFNVRRQGQILNFETGTTTAAAASAGDYGKTVQWYTTDSPARLGNAVAFIGFDGQPESLDFPPYGTFTKSAFETRISRVPDKCVALKADAGGACVINRNGIVAGWIDEASMSRGSLWEWNDDRVGPAEAWSSPDSFECRFDSLEGHDEGS